MNINTKDIFQLREETGAGVMAAKEALQKAQGEYGKAKAILAKKLGEKVLKKQDRETREGVIQSYIHDGGKIGVLLELNCETDFVARNPGFQEFAHEVALQIAAVHPQNVEALLESPYWRDEKKSVRQLKDEMIAKFGENIVLRRFTRYALSE